MRAVEYGAFERVGGTAKVEIDPRIIGATNFDMPQGKLEAIRGWHKTLLTNAMQTKKSKRERDQVREADSTNVFLRLEQMLHRVDLMVAERNWPGYETPCSIRSLPISRRMRNWERNWRN